MTIEEKAKELGSKYARQYHHNNCFLTHDPSYVSSCEEIADACIEMAECQIQKACENLDRMGICSAFRRIREIPEDEFKETFKQLMEK